MTMSVDQFRNIAANVTRKVEDERIQARDAYQEVVRLGVETTGSGPAWLLSVALLASRLEGFPSRVPLGSPNGYNADKVLVRDNAGVWRFALRAPDDRSMGDVMRYNRADELGYAALNAMGVAGNRRTYEMVKGLMSWGKTYWEVEDNIRSVLSRVPAHVLPAAVANGSDTLDMLCGLSATRAAQDDVVCGVVRAAIKFGVDFDAPFLSTGVPMLMWMSGSHVRWSNIMFDAVRNRMNLEAVDTRGQTALMRNCNTSHHQTHVIRDLLQAGAMPDTRDGAGMTALHHAVKSYGCGASMEAVMDVCNMLIDAGASTDITDTLGETAMDMLPAYLREDDTHPNSEQALDRLRMWFDNYSLNAASET